MRKLLLALALVLAPVSAWAQCNGIFPATTACGSVGGGPPGPVPFGSITGSGVSAINGLSGSVTLAAGANMTITVAGQTITLASTGGGGGGGGVTSVNAVTGDVLFPDGNSIFVDTGGQNITVNAVGGQRIITGAGAVTVAATDGYIFLNQGTPAAVTVNLPAAASRPTSLELTIKDLAGVATNDPITVVANGSETIDGSASVTLTTNKASCTLVPISGTGWAIK